MADNVLEPYTFSFGDAKSASIGCSSRVWVFPTSILQRKTSRCIYVCIACGCYEASQRASQIWKLFSNQDRQLSSSPWSGRLFFCSGSFRVCNRSKQGELVPTHDFWIRFYKPSFKTLVGLRPNPMFSKKIALTVYPRWCRMSKFSQKKFVLGKFALIHSILHQTGTITSGFEGKKRKYHFLKIWTLLWYALSRTFSKKRKHPFRFFLGILLKSTENRKECFLKISASLWYAFYKPSSNLENRMTVCMGYPAMTPQGRAGKRRWKGVGSPCRENGWSTNRFLKGDGAHSQPF